MVGIVANRAFRKDIRRTIAKSFSRFLAIAAIVALGSGFYAGLRMAGPDMRLALQEYADSENLYDLRIVSNSGLYTGDIDRIKEINNTEVVVPVFSQDVLIKEGKTFYSSRFESLDENSFNSSAEDANTGKINNIRLIEGSFPKASNECLALAGTIGSQNLSIGSKIEVACSNEEIILSKREFEVVGFVDSPCYANRNALGPTDVGSGMLQQVLYIPNDGFKEGIAYTGAYLRANHKASSVEENAYNAEVSRVKDAIDDKLSSLEEENHNEALSLIHAEVNKEKEKYFQEQQQKAQKNPELYRQLSNSKFQARQQLAFDKKVEELEKEVPETKWHILDRDKNAGWSEYNSDATRMENIARVFPLFFFIVAALVSLTTMTRMVEDERMYIGTCKALGFSTPRIASKYLLYAILSSGIGSIVGVLLLSQVLPQIIHQAYAVAYKIPLASTPVDIPIAALSIAIGVGTALVATIAAIIATLKESPAALMQEKVPSIGKKILLERLPLWNRLSFSWKVSLRNIFRYKKRFFMTIAGVAGCTALLVTGLGLSNALNDIVPKQYDEIQLYDAQINLKSSYSDEDFQQVSEVLNNKEYVSNWIEATTASYLAVKGDENRSVQVFVPESHDEFSEFVSLRNRKDKEPITFDEDSVVISEKLAIDYDLKPGDTLVLSEQNMVGDPTDELHALLITAVAENYLNNPLYLGKHAYKELTGDNPAVNACLIKRTNLAKDTEDFADQMRTQPAVKTYSTNAETIDLYEKMLKSVDSVVVLLVVAAAVLAFIVLYNLMNINISERAREVATLKVLGFYRREVDAYIFREVMILASIGSLVGLVLGVFMEQFVILTGETDYVMFVRGIHPESFVIAVALTILFAACVCLMLKGKLERIDMVESLKPGE